MLYIILSLAFSGFFPSFKSSLVFFGLGFVEFKTFWLVLSVVRKKLKYNLKENNFLLIHIIIIYWIIYNNHIYFSNSLRIFKKKKLKDNIFFVFIFSSFFKILSKNAFIFETCFTLLAANVFLKILKKFKTRHQWNQRHSF